MIGVREGGTQALHFDVVRVPAEQSLGDYLNSGWMENVDKSSTEDITINGFPAASTSAQGEQWSFRVYALRFGSEVYRFIFAAKQKNTESDRNARETVSSFRRLTLDEIQAARPLRIKVITVQPGDTVESLSHRMAGVDRPTERFRILNGLDAHAQVKVRDLVNRLVMVANCLAGTDAQLASDLLQAQTFDVPEHQVSIPAPICPAAFRRRHWFELAHRVEQSLAQLVRGRGPSRRARSQGLGVGRQKRPIVEVLEQLVNGSRQCIVPHGAIITDAPRVRSDLLCHRRVTFVAFFRHSTPCGGPTTLVPLRHERSGDYSPGRRTGWMTESAESRITR